MRRRILILASASLVVGCGGSSLPAADTSHRSTTTTPPEEPAVRDSSTDVGPIATTLAGRDPVPESTARAPEIVTGAWEDVTANLVGLASECGNMSFVSAHSARDQVIAGVARQGLWALHDGSTEWVQLGSASGSAQIVNRTSAIAYDPDDPARFWESGTYAAGAYRTDDGGASFEQLGSIDHLDHISVDLTDPDRRTLLAGGHERTAVYLSTDGGESWTDIAANLPAGVGFTSFPIVLDATTFLLGTYNGEESGIFRSEDGGETWIQIVEGPVAGAPVVVDDSVYWLSDRGGGVLVSKDRGVSFDWSGMPTGGRPTSLLLLPDGRLATVGGSFVLISADEGASWTDIGPPLPYEPRGLAYSPARHAFYIWFFTCDFSGAGNPVLENAIMRLEVDLSSG